MDNQERNQNFSFGGSKYEQIKKKNTKIHMKNKTSIYSMLTNINKNIFFMSQAT